MGPDAEDAITRATTRALAQGQREFAVQLEPPELGRVRVVLRESPAGLDAAIEVERPETQRLVAAGLDGLRTSLREAGVEVRDFDVRGDDAGRRPFQHGGDPDGAAHGGSDGGGRDGSDPALPGEAPEADPALFEDGDADRGRAAPADGAIDVLA
jgi:flagellar hook-length control protein FliK